MAARWTTISAILIFGTLACTYACAAYPKMADDGGGSAGAVPALLFDASKAESPGQIEKREIVLRLVWASFEILLHILNVAITTGAMYIAYNVVFIQSIRDPVLLPGLLDMCPKVDYKDIPQRERCRCCMICLMGFAESDVCRLLECQHFFHASCVDPWLEKKSTRCPLCNRRMSFTQTNV